MELNFDFILKKLSSIQSTSRAEKRKVGCLIVNLSKEDIIVSVGRNYNPFNDGVCETSDNETFDSVVHAEEDAIFKAIGENKSLTGCIMFCTYSPCIHCARMIAQVGISRLYYLEEHRTNFRNFEEHAGSLSPFEFLTKSGVEVFKYNNITKVFDKQEMFNAIKDICIVYHSKDNDGRMSGYLLNKLYSGDSFGYDYSDVNPQWKQKDYPIYIFGDITPDLEWFKEKLDLFLTGQKTIIIYDHHKDRLSQLKYLFYGFSTKNIIIHENTQDFVSAARVIWNEHYHYLDNILPHNFNELVNITSQYDTWLFKEPEFSATKRITVELVTNYLYSFRDYHAFCREIDSIKSKLFENDTLNWIDKACDYGRVLARKSSNEMKNLITDNSMRYEIDDVATFVVFQGYPTADTEDIIRKQYWIEDFEPLVWCGMKIDLKQSQLIMSFRSDKNSKLTALQCAKLFGGGGHVQAAGCQIPLKEGTKYIENTYELVKLLNQFSYEH